MARWKDAGSLGRSEVIRVFWNVSGCVASAEFIHSSLLICLFGKRSMHQAWKRIWRAQNTKCSRSYQIEGRRLSVSSHQGYKNARKCVIDCSFQRHRAREAAHSDVMRSFTPAFSCHWSSKAWSFRAIGRKRWGTKLNGCIPSLRSMVCLATFMWPCGLLPKSSCFLKISLAQW